MLGKLAEVYPTVASTFVEASEALGLDLWQLVREGPAEDLNVTWNTQPAMLAAGIAVWRVWLESGGTGPADMAGHSLGEYTALVAAGSIEFPDAVRLVAERGRLMQEAVAEGTGAMAAILGLDDGTVRSLCEQAAADQTVEAVNYNSPGQVVVAGDKAAVERLMELAKQAGAKRALLLPVSVPSHCALMKPAAERLARRLEETRIATPRIAVLHNVSVETVKDPEQIRRLLEQQLFSPVRWVESVQRMRSDGSEILLEGGPGKVLTGLSKRIDRSIRGLCIEDPESLQSALEATANA
jgi:[acyl-carrier-protein] S-malonyltransferase